MEESSKTNVENPKGSGRVLDGRVTGRLAAAGIIISHTLQHLYIQGFYVIIPVIYTSLGLTPVAAGFIGTIRQVSSGVVAIIGGFALDKFQHRRILVLFLSLLLMGLGYLLVGLSPTYLSIYLSIDSVVHRSCRRSRLYMASCGIKPTLSAVSGTPWLYAGATPLQRQHR